MKSSRGASPRRSPPREWAVPPPRSIAGQASAEYVALLAVVGAVVAGAAAVGSPPALALKLAAALRHGICLRGGRGLHAAARRARRGSRPASSRRARTASGWAAGCWSCASVAATRCSSSAARTARPRSPSPTAASAGATVGVGLRLPAGPRVGVRGGAGVQFSAGPHVGVRELRRGGALRAALGAAGVARRGGARAAPPRLPDLPPPAGAADAEARRDLPRGRGLRRVRRCAAPRAPQRAARAPRRRARPG